MTTRFYLYPGLTPSITPAFDAGWELTTGAVRRFIATSIDPGQLTTAESLAVAEVSATAPYDVLIAQFISGPISGTPTIGGGGATLKGQIRASESNTLADFQAQLVCRVVSNDGTTFRGTILGFDTTALGATPPEFGTSLTNRKFPLTSPAATTGVVATDGDRLVVEVGYRSSNTSTTSRTGTIDVRQDSATDLAVDETTTAANNPWFEFSDTLTLKLSDSIKATAMEAAGTTTRSPVAINAVGAEAAGVTTRSPVAINAILLEVAVCNDAGYWDIGMESFIETS